ncbi:MULTISPECIES: restriction endonuclease [unclassified Streptomyces]|uniref:restriction endonuclease n=1 Tax=unclassified Streptomyces TaxID=2593676 RepID=UPI002E29E272|nr:restriction endonuclease [Streptomyces sp. NBC_00223]
MAAEPMPTKPISPAAYGALETALKHIFWYKSDLEGFIRRWAKGYPGLLAGLDFSGYKWRTAEEFVDRLQADEGQYGKLAISLMIEVSEMPSFPKLKRHEDADTLIAEAREAVAALKSCIDRHRGLIANEARFTSDLADRRAAAESRRSFAQRLSELKDEFLRLEREPNRQKAGREFEPFLNQLFRLFDLDPRLSYSLPYEQIDGSITYDTDVYIVEAKWLKEPVEVHYLGSFVEKVRHKGKNALGLYISVHGFTKGAKERYAEGTCFITMEGIDLFAVLDGHTTLDELLSRKKRHANDTGSCYYPASLMMSE